jgi:hypothetical protein
MWGSKTLGSNHARVCGCMTTVSTITASFESRNTLSGDHPDYAERESLRRSLGAVRAHLSLVREPKLNIISN